LNLYCPINSLLKKDIRKRTKLDDLPVLFISNLAEAWRKRRYRAVFLSKLLKKVKIPIKFSV